ncbi:MAG: hypoxanthine phosphoribosyltransferase [Verrucomicrobia bacterium]|nr:hypoxanthine phosphoribosyltransferase [Verrucomicrobiota bacterium]MBU6446711.1 hypoxanthine phosphoribosyltransferase [Verrucomicrobiota bacterium]MDE3047806.1 hypoxanthine phosphoribosyltransferase [Verrucomicrobiota bacterium]
MDANLKSLLSREEIAEKVKGLSQQIERDYQGKDLVIVMVLKGALCLVADLIRELNLPLDVQTVQCSSYGAGGTKRGALTVLGAERLKIHNRDVLIVDDIFDSGQTMVTLENVLREMGPRSLKTCVLLYKQDVPKVTDVRPDYVLFDIPDLFVVGYGLDFKERYRGLPGVYVLESP